MVRLRRFFRGRSENKFARFNPIMVRLRLCDLANPPRPFGGGFNPIMVRLRLLLLPLKYPLTPCFNPIMVRLRQGIQNSWDHPIWSFNPIMVRLRRRAPNLPHLSHLSFNPIMVRLRPREKCRNNKPSYSLLCRRPVVGVKRVGDRRQDFWLKSLILEY